MSRLRFYEPGDRVTLRVGPVPGTVTKVGRRPRPGVGDQIQWVTVAFDNGHEARVPNQSLEEEA